jgi:hypothetical protein
MDVYPLTEAPTAFRSGRRGGKPIIVVDDH